MAKDIEVTVPDIGDYQDVPVVDILVKPGDKVEKDAPLLTLESDKATMDVPAPEAGVVGALKVKVGDRVSRGSAVLLLQAEGAAKPGAARAVEKKTDKPVKADATPPPTAAKAEKKAGPVAPSTAARTSSKVEVTVPDIGDYHDVPVIEVFVKDGDRIDKDAPLITLESDKATMEVPAPAAGVVRQLRVKIGDRVSKGAPVCTIETDAADDAVKASPVAGARSSAAAAEAVSASPGALVAAPEPPPASPLPLKPATAAGDLPHASPSVRKYARELGVDLQRVQGSGPRGRITHEDVQGFVKQALSAPSTVPGSAGGATTGGGIPSIPAIDFTQFGEIETKPLARIRKLSAAHLHRSWLNIPHVTQTDEADITELEAFRKAQSEELAAAGGVKLTLLPFLLKAAAVAMKQHPEFNASLAPDGESLILKKYCHIGFAADTPNGLVVPVVRDVDKKGVTSLAAECAELAKKARDGKLKADEMKGGCFSISSLGGIGGSHFTPIVNAPEVGILGVSRSQMKPIWDGKEFQPRLMLPLSLSYDHRVIDGAYAARFIVTLVKLLGDVRRLVL
jgi:pyruvate dehydrogenase E2 component (dihydrolipoamide acetyltransferase)